MVSRVNECPQFFPLCPGVDVSRQTLILLSSQERKKRYKKERVKITTNNLPPGFLH
jgi:hypothetical protein